MSALVCPGEMFTFYHCELFEAVIYCVQLRCGHATSTVASYPGAQWGGAEEERKKSVWYLLHTHALNVRVFYCKISRLCFDNVVAVILDDALVITSSVSTCVALDHSPCAARIMSRRTRYHCSAQWWTGEILGVGFVECD